MPTNFIKTSQPTKSGNFNYLWWSPISNIESVTLNQANGAVTAIAMKEVEPGTDHKFAYLEANFNTVRYESAITMNRNTVNADSVRAVLNDVDISSLFVITKEIQAALPCGIALVRIDNNGRVMISGISTGATKGKNKPYLNLAINKNSGENFEDDMGNKAELIFSRETGDQEYYLGAFDVVDTAANLEILDKPSILT